MARNPGELRRLESPRCRRVVTASKPDSNPERHHPCACRATSCFAPISPFLLSRKSDGWPFAAASLVHRAVLCCGLFAHECGGWATLGKPSPNSFGHAIGPSAEGTPQRDAPSGCALLDQRQPQTQRPRPRLTARKTLSHHGAAGVRHLPTRHTSSGLSTSALYSGLPPWLGQHGSPPRGPPGPPCFSDRSLDRLPGLLLRTCTPRKRHPASSKGPSRCASAIISSSELIGRRGRVKLARYRSVGEQCTRPQSCGGTGGLERTRR